VVAIVFAAALAAPGLAADKLVKAPSSWTREAVKRAVGPFDYEMLVDNGVKVREFHHGLTADDRFPPCSTYKLPHALIGLDAGAIRLDTHFQCNPKECHADHGDCDLPKAIRESCVSYFRQVAARLGRSGEEAGLKKLGYPRRKVPEAVGAFWLTDRGFAVSTLEQLAFFRRFYTEALPVDPAYLDAVRQMSVRTSLPRFTIAGKTGSGKKHGWFVAEIDRGGRKWWLALLIRGEGASGMKGEEIIHRLLGID
jgi:beta-lactamase class D